MPSRLQLEEKNCRDLYNDLRSGFQALSLLLLCTLAVHSARCCQHPLPWLSSTFTSTTCSNICWCVSLMQRWKKSSITYTCSPSWFSLLLIQLSVNTDRSEVMVCLPRTWWPWGQELSALSFPGETMEMACGGQWSRLGLQGYLLLLCPASVLCLKKARRCVSWNCCFFAILWFFHWEGEEGCPPASPLQLPTLMSIPAPWVGHPAKASAGAWASEWKATHLLLSSLSLDGTF